MKKNIKIMIIILCIVFIIPLAFLPMLIGYISVNLFVNEVRNYKNNKELLNKITYEVPDYFDDEGSEYGYNKYYNYYNDGVSCSFSISASASDDDFTSWFKGKIYVNLNYEVSELDNININGNNALYIKTLNNSGVDYYYGIKSADNYYLLNYSIYDYNHGDNASDEDNLCYSSLDKILSSIEIK